MFEDKDTDPRECLYRWKPSSKLRNQIDRLLRAKKAETGAGGQGRDSEHQGATGGGPVNRKKGKKAGAKPPPAATGSKHEALFDPAESRKQALVAAITEVEGILSTDDDGHFTYEQLSRLHQLLQRLDADRYGAAYFFEFLETNFRLARLPETRQNPELDQRLRSLKLKAAAAEYQSMVANVATARCANGHTGKTPQFSLSQELRNIRSTLLATLNAIMVVVATFAFFYLAISYARPDYTTANVVLFSFGASMVVAAAELYFLIRII